MRYSKKHWIYILFFFIHNFSFGQPESVLKSFTPQINMNSCWAACLEMTGARLNNLMPNSEWAQHQFIFERKFSDSISCCSCPPGINYSFNTSTIQEDELFMIVNNRFSRFYPKKTGETIGLSNLKDYLGAKYNGFSYDQSPIIYNYRYESDMSHVVLLTNIKSQNFMNNEISLIQVNDPWPTCKGNRFLMTFERYNLQPEKRTSESSGLNIGKYSIYFSTKSLNRNPTEDAIYLNRIFRNVSEYSLVNDFLNAFSKLPDTLNTLDKDFYEITNFQKGKFDELYASHILDIVNIGVSDSLKIAQNKINLDDLLNVDIDKKMVFFANKNTGLCRDTIRTIASISKPKSSTFWQFSHFENGTIWDSKFRAICKSRLFESFYNSKSRFRAVAILFFENQDEYYLLFKRNKKYYMSNIYGNSQNNSSELTSLNDFFNNKQQ